MSVKETRTLPWGWPVPDDVLLRIGTNSNGVLLNRSTVLAANTALTSVLVGTPVTQATPANSIILSNVTANGDIVLAVNNGGNSLEALRVGASAKTLFLGWGLTKVQVGSGVFAASANYLASDTVGFELVQNSLATPSTQHDASLIVQKWSAVTDITGVNAAGYFSAIKTTATNLHRATALFAEGQDNAGGSGSFVEGVRGHGVVTAGVSGSGYGAVLSGQGTAAVSYKYLVGAEGEVINKNADTGATFNKDNYAASFVATSRGTKTADAGFLTNPYTAALGKFREGFLVAEASVSDAAFRSRAATVWGLDLMQGTQSYAAIGIPNNASIRAKNAAGSADLNFAVVNTSNALVLGTDTAFISIPVNNTASQLVLTAPNPGTVGYDTSPIAAIKINAPAAAWTRNFESGIWIVTSSATIDKGRGIIIDNKSSRSDAIYIDAQASGANGGGVGLAVDVQDAAPSSTNSYGVILLVKSNTSTGIKVVTPADATTGILGQFDHNGTVAAELVRIGILGNASHTALIIRNTGANGNANALVLKSSADAEVFAINAQTGNFRTSGKQQIGAAYYGTLPAAALGVDGGVMIGANSTNNLIANASNGAGTATLYIGNKAILVNNGVNFGPAAVVSITVVGGQITAIS